jgi:S1-C subfamily serine protease
MHGSTRIAGWVWLVVALAAGGASAQVLPEIEDSIQKIAARASSAVWLVEAEPDPAKFKLSPAASSAYRYIKRGAAFAWEAEGLLITAHSVVSDTRGGTVTLAQRDRRLEAAIVGSDAETDVALLKVGTGQLGRVLPLGASEAIKAGAFALVLGPDLVPLRLSPGWVNHVEMRLPGYRESLLVVNTAVDAGAAGTPVIGSDGRVMGVVYAGGFGRPAVSWSLVHRTPNRTIINAVPEPQRRADGQQDFVVKMHVSGTAAGAVGGAAQSAPGLQVQVKSDGTPQIVVHGNGREVVVDALKLTAGGVEWMDIGFGNSPATAMIGGSGPPTYVVPVDVVRGVLDDLKAHKQVRRGQLGVVLMDAVAGSGKPGGALVYRIVEGGPAEKAGIKAGEVIVAAGGKTVADSGELIRCTRARRDGDSVEMIVLAADGKTRTCTVRLAPLSVWAAREAGMLAPRSNVGSAVPKVETPGKPGEPRDNE